MESALTGVAKGWVSEIVSKAGALDQIGINEAISREGFT